MTKVLTLLGTRPEIIRLSRVIALLDESCDHVLVHTGQNYDDRLSGMFFREMGVREPDVYMGVRGTGFADQIGQMFAKCRGALPRREARHRADPRRHEHRPRRVRRQAHGHPRLPHGGGQPLLRRPRARRGQPPRHRPLEQRAHALHLPQRREPRARGHRAPAHLRDRQPHQGGARLLRAADRRRRPVHAVRRRARQVLPRHRAPRRDDRRTPSASRRSSRRSTAPSRSTACRRVASLHPRTADKMEAFGVAEGAVKFVPPMGLFDFVRLEKEAFCVLSDSGTVQEECCIFGVPTVTMRDVTERPETIECGSNMLAGVEAERILPAIDLAVRSRRHVDSPGRVPRRATSPTWSRASCWASRERQPAHPGGRRQRHAGARGDPRARSRLRGVGRVPATRRSCPTSACRPSGCSAGWTRPTPTPRTS